MIGAIARAAMVVALLFTAGLWLAPAGAARAENAATNAQSAIGVWREPQDGVWTLNADGTASLFLNATGPSNGVATWRQQGRTVTVRLVYRNIAVSWRYTGELNAAGDQIVGRAFRTEGGVEEARGAWSVARR